jgi:hypothetical protein
VASASPPLDPGCGHQDPGRQRQPLARVFASSGLEHVPPLVYEAANAPRVRRRRESLKAAASASRYLLDGCHSATGSRPLLGTSPQVRTDRHRRPSATRTRRAAIQRSSRRRAADAARVRAAPAPGGRANQQRDRSTTLDPRGDDKHARTPPTREAAGTHSRPRRRPRTPPPPAQTTACRLDPNSPRPRHRGRLALTSSRGFGSAFRSILGGALWSTGHLPSRAYTLIRSPSALLPFPGTEHHSRDSAGRCPHQPAPSGLAHATPRVPGRVASRAAGGTSETVLRKAPDFYPGDSAHADGVTSAGRAGVRIRLAPRRPGVPALARGRRRERLGAARHSPNAEHRNLARF